MISIPVQGQEHGAGDPERMPATLLGAVADHSNRTDVKFLDLGRVTVGQRSDAIHVALGGDFSPTAYDEGRALSADAAIALALAQVPPDIASALAR